MEAHTLFQFNATSDEELSFPAGVIIKVDAVNCFCFSVSCFECSVKVSLQHMN